ncbi:hypothetical protein JMJ35_006935 [Cladonia borealis]|uniref:Ankyrin repeat protein n=1 Tax=Cladonia borealis TaxID=184061 RepID=A0AA39QZD2_9LECA|nr:hypothetical protein JMJ35_006935 [Cladonia borealis]
MGPTSITNSIDTLYDAIRTGNLYTVKRYINAQGDKSNVDWDDTNAKNGWTPLIKATSLGYRDIVRLLLGYSSPGPGPTIDATGDVDETTALILAAQGGRLDIARQLLQANGKPRHLNIQDKNGETALVAAARKGNWATASVIVGYNPAINLVNNDHDGALHFAIKARQTRLVKRMLDLPKGAAAAKQKNSENITPLHLSALSGASIIATDLLDAGADRNAMDSWGETAEGLANRIGNTAVAVAIWSHP